MLVRVLKIQTHDLLDSLKDFRHSASLIRRCSNLKDLKQIHGQIAAAGYDHYTFLGNHLIHMYGKCGSPSEAWVAFSQIHRKNLFSWNIMLTAFAQNGDLDRANEVFEKMPKQDACSWNSMIAASVQNSDVIEAQFLFEQMPGRDPVSWNTMIAAYAECGHLLEAKSLFDQMPDRSTVSWNTMVTAYAQNSNAPMAKTMFDRMPQFNLLTYNAMIAAYSQNGYPRRAIRLFGAMDLEAIEPDVFSYVSLLDSCAVLGDPALGEAVHIEMKHRNLDESNVIVATALVTMYGRCGRIESAKTIFDLMPEKNVISWIAMLAVFAENGQLEEAKGVFGKIPLKNSAAGNAMLTGYAQQGLMQEARKIFHWIQEKDVISWNSMITAYTQAEQPAEAFLLFRKMDLEGMLPNRVTLIALLHSCDGHSALYRGRILHKSAAELNLELDVAVGTALVIMYGRCGSLSSADAAFNKMMERNSVTWSCIVAAYAQNGHTTKAIELFQELNLEGMCPDSMLFNSILFACSHRGLLHDGLRHFVLMVGDFEVVPNYSHFLCMVDLLGRAGQLEAAEMLIDSMPFEADAMAWTILLSACKSNNDVQRGEFAAKKVLEVDSQQPSSYVMLSSMYQTRLNQG